MSDVLSCPLCKIGEVGYTRVGDDWHTKCRACGTENPHLVAARRGIEQGGGFSLALLAKLPSKAFEHTIDQLSEEYPNLRVLLTPDEQEPF